MIQSPLYRSVQRVRFMMRSMRGAFGNYQRIVWPTLSICCSKSVLMIFHSPVCSESWCFISPQASQNKALRQNFI